MDCVDAQGFLDPRIDSGGHMSRVNVEDGQDEYGQEQGRTGNNQQRHTQNAWNKPASHHMQQPTYQQMYYQQTYPQPFIVQQPRIVKDTDSEPVSSSERSRKRKKKIRIVKDTDSEPGSSSERSRKRKKKSSGDRMTMTKEESNEAGARDMSMIDGDSMTMTKEESYNDKYKMNHQKRGQAVIINNKTFDSKLSLEERTGTDKDSAALSELFSKMGFDVLRCSDYKATEMKQVLEKCASHNDYNKQSDAFICAILSHGKEDAVFGTDSEIEIQELLKPFKGNNSPGLVGKPKIFFIQACRGKNLDDGARLHTTDGGDFTSIQPELEVRIQKIPVEADFLIAYSTVQGYSSWRHKANGTWFIQSLTEILDKNWDKMDLLTMMTKVNKKVAYKFEAMNQKKQVPCITSMLTKEVRFEPK